MKKIRMIKWVNGETGEFIGEHPLAQAANDDYLCPKCGKPCHYWEGQIDQDRMGNDIHGWSFDCHDCNMCTEPMEGTWGYDYS